MLSDAERRALLEEFAKTRVGDGLGDVPGPEAQRRSPACGDEVTVRVVLDGDAIAAVRWTGHGCVVSTAAASALSSVTPGVTREGFAALADRYLATLDADADADAGAEPDAGLGDLEAFAGIGRYPLRAGCASLAWRAALAALAD